MELLPKVKDYIEKNIELLDKDPFEFIQAFMINSLRSEEKEQFLHIMLDTIGTLKDFDDAVAEVKKKLDDVCTQIENTHNVAGVRPIIEFYRNTELSTIEDLAKHNVNNLHVTTTETNTSPKNFDPSYTFITRDSYTAGTLVQLIKDNVKSSSIGVKKPLIYLSIEDIYTQDFVKAFATEYDRMCQEIKQAIQLCFKSFEWRKVIEEDIAPELLEKLNNMSQEILGEEIYQTYAHDNYVMFNVNYKIRKQTKINFEFELNFTTDPVKIDIDAIVADHQKKLIKFKGTLDKRLERQQERELLKQNAPEVKFSRKDISDAIRAVGHTPSSFVYTNKYPNTTTYKYQFMDLDSDECEAIKQQLLKKNIPVLSVSSEQSYSGRGPYTSLFVKVRNF